MKLEPKAKPVRIRIKSGGEEHSTLESLKRNFSVDDLKPAVEDRRLSRWLKQQGQNELAEGVLRYQGKMKSLSGNDYLGFIKLFFANEPDIETVTDDYSLADFFYGKWEKNFDRVFERCCEKQSFAAIHYFYKTYKDKKNTDSWIELFESLKDGLEPKNMANCLAELAILYGERNMPIKKIRSLCSAIAIGSKDAERELQNMTQSDSEMGANALNSPNDWLSLLEKFEKKAGHSDKCEFLRDLAIAYKSVGDLNRVKQFLTEAAQMGDKESAELLLEGADFRTVKTLYETPGSKGLFSPQRWLVFFENIEGKVDEADKIEYYTTLYRQHSKLGNKGLAEKCRQECLARGGKIYGDNMEFNVNGVCLKMVFVQGGTFTMGATVEQCNCAEDDEKPAHNVTLNDFYIGDTQVTQALWKAVMGREPYHDGGWKSVSGKGDEYPAYRISWNDCQSFINNLNNICSSQLKGKKFAMPTEAEWEYAARGGQKSQGYKYSGSKNIGEVANYDNYRKGKTCLVAHKKPNELGLYDMSGNVEEWCADWKGNYSMAAQINPVGPKAGSYRVIRGGSWEGKADFCRVSSRNGRLPEYSDFTIGLRLALH
ncbi:MAG: formylglycine-generating enzyme family protein [bacterium]|nr:formylglycine-generating enzyme family protein [Candidatus Limimorpha equi]